MIVVTKKPGSDTPTTFVLQWTPVPGCQGYLFIVDGKQVSRSFDPTKHEAKFSKGAQVYTVEAITFRTIDSGSYPQALTYKRVAPKTANKQDGSDARFCVVGQPGVILQPDGTYRDDVARYDTNGLLLGGRSTACTQDWTPGLVGAKEMDGREPCALPRVGVPTDNTGSWQI